MKQFITLLLLFFATAVWAQQRRVTGIVVAKNTQAALSGVTVQSKAQTVSTDSTGHFSVLASTGETLTFTYVGMQAGTTQVPASGTITMELTENPNDLNAVVVTGYQTQ